MDNASRRDTKLRNWSSLLYWMTEHRRMDVSRTSNSTPVASVSVSSTVQGYYESDFRPERARSCWRHERLQKTENDYTEARLTSDVPLYGWITSANPILTLWFDMFHRSKAWCALSSHSTTSRELTCTWCCCHRHASRQHSCT